MQTLQENPEMLFEASWEVCNKIGGIYTVLSTKANVLAEKYGDKLVFIGPDFGDSSTSSQYFAEAQDDEPLNLLCHRLQLPYGIHARAGRWRIPGEPQVVLVSFDGVYPEINTIFGRIWEQFKVNSLHAYGDYNEGCAFGIAVAYTISALAKVLGQNSRNIIAHFNEWTTGMGLLMLRSISPEIASLFTTHATSIGRSICGNGKPLYDYMSGYNGDQMAFELNMEAKHSLEKTAAWQADCFTTVSDVTAAECRQLLDIVPQVVTPNGFDSSFIPEASDYKQLRISSRRRILTIASEKYEREFRDKETFILATSGRNEFRNKGLDMFLDALARIDGQELGGKEILACIFVPGWTSCVNTATANDTFFTTHRLHNEDTDQLFIKTKETVLSLGKKSKVSIMFVPCYLDGKDGVLDISYYDMLPAIDATVFASYYEPWGYTPLESVAFHVPTITTDKAGFGQWALEQGRGTISAGGVEVVERTDSNYWQSVEKIVSTVAYLCSLSPTKIAGIRKKAHNTSNMAEWKTFIYRYYEAFEVAFRRRNARMNRD